MEIIFRIGYSPNSVNLWKRVKAELACGRRKKIEMSHCKFNIRDNYSEEELFEDIRRIHNERFEHEYDFTT